MLEYRLTILDKVVDYFIIVEANQTFVGAPKPLYFSENKSRFKKYENKIIHVVVDLPHGNNTWLNEYFQRNAISIGVNHIQPSNQDMIIISDVDEIPDDKVLHACKTGVLKFDGISLLQDLYYYNIEHSLGSWSMVKVLMYDTFKKCASCESIRTSSFPQIKKGGWHLSYFGNAEFISNKIKNFSHQELNCEEFTNVSKIQERLDKGGDVFDRVMN